VTHMNDYAHEWLVCGTYFMCQTTCDSFVCVTWLDRGRLALMNESRETNEWVMWRAWMTHMWHILHRYARHASFVAQINESCDADEWLVCGTYLMWPIEWCDTDEWVTSNVTQMNESRVLRCFIMPTLVNCYGPGVLSRASQWGRTFDTHELLRTWMTRMWHIPHLPDIYARSHLCA